MGHRGSRNCDKGQDRRENQEPTGDSFGHVKVFPLDGRAYGFRCQHNLVDSGQVDGSAVRFNLLPPVHEEESRELSSLRRTPAEAGGRSSG